MNPTYINTGMQLKDWVQLAIGSGGLVGIAILIYRLGRVVERVEQLYTNHLPHIYEALKALHQELQGHKHG